MKKEQYFPEIILHSRNLKATTTRLTVLNEILNYGTAMPFSVIQQKLKNTDRVTLYRTIDTLLENGLIHRALAGHNEVYYALCGEECTASAHNHNHIHFKCSSCHQVSCQHLKGKMSVSLLNFDIQQLEIQAAGVCANCRS